MLWRWKRPKNGRVRVIGHRGAKALVTENTIASFERARVDGADGVELDVRQTADGVVVVMHDPDLSRVTSKRDTRSVARITLEALRDVVLDGDARAPTLAEVLAWADAHDMRVNVELKHDVPDERALATATARLLRSHGRAAERVLLSSFQPRLLGWMRALVPKVPRAFLFHEKQRFARTPFVRAIARAVGAVALHPERTLCSPDRVRAWKSHGYLVNVWTVNDVDEARDLADLGVDAIITDDPARVGVTSSAGAVDRS
jgi:glycerophosphoryl diester phosphodiesterase